jgi:WD40 repeat protein
VADDGEFVAAESPQEQEDEQPAGGRRKSLRVGLGLTVFSLPKGEPVFRSPSFQWDQPGPVAFSPRSTWLATTTGFARGGTGEKVVCTPVRTPADAAREFVGHTGRVRAVAFSPDETRMLTGGNDGTVRVWDTATTECLLTLKAGGSVVQLAMTPDVRRVVALIEDPNTFSHHVRVWEPKDPFKKP